MTHDTTRPGNPAGPPAADGARAPLAKILRRGSLVLVIGAAVAAAWWFTRSASPEAAMEEHNHAAPAGDESTRQPVMLSQEAARRIGVTYATVLSGPIEAKVRVVGIVTTDETRVKTISPKIEGYVEELFVAFTGESVNEGTPLLRLYSPVLVAAQEELVLARKLVDDVAGGSPRAMQDATSLLESARRRLLYWDVPEADVARVEQSGAVTKTLTLRSPVRGVVVERNVLAGQRVMAGDALYVVADLREVWVEGEVFERDLPAVRLGQSVTLDVDALPGRPRTGRIVFISPTLSPETRTAQIRVALTNDDLALKPGMYATLQVRVRSPSAIHVPRSAILATGERTIVFTRDADGMLRAREVELGATAGDRVTIRRGLTAGEVVVSSATFLIDAESNLGAALAAMASMPGMAEMPGVETPPAKSSSTPNAARQP